MTRIRLTFVEAKHAKQLAVMRGFLDGRQFYTAADALEFARQLEQGTRKDGKTPKFDHQLSIAQLIITLIPHLMHPEWAVAAAFLHDVMEDHPIEFGDLAERFRDELAEIVWLLSKKSNGITKDYERYFGDLAGCPTASVVKLADRAHNIQTMQGVFSLEKQQAYLREVEDWFFPLGKTARRAFPAQYGAYENLKILLLCQCQLIRCIHEAAEVR